MTDNLTDRENQIQRLQTNLEAIRKIAGWTAKDLGEKIGVTKQTISNLENSKTKMNFTQYIAIRSVLDAEVERHPDNELLPEVIKILLDSGDKLDDETYEKAKWSSQTLAATIAGGATIPAAIAIFGGIMPLVAQTVADEITKSAWKKLLK